MRKSQTGSPEYEVEIEKRSNRKCFRCLLRSKGATCQCSRCRRWNSRYYFLCKSICGEKAIAKWTVLEVESLTRGLSEKITGDTKLSYISDLDALDTTIDCVVISATLPSLPDPMGILTKILELRPLHVFISKTPYWPLPVRLTKQLSWKHEGWVRRQSYPFWILNDGEVNRLFRRRGYSKIMDNPDAERQQMYVTNHAHISLRSLLFTSAGAEQCE